MSIIRPRKAYYVQCKETILREYKVWADSAEDARSDVKDGCQDGETIEDATVLRVTILRVGRKPSFEVAKP